MVTELCRGLYGDSPEVVSRRFGKCWRRNEGCVKILVGTLVAEVELEGDVRELPVAAKETGLREVVSGL